MKEYKVSGYLPDGNYETGLKTLVIKAANKDHALRQVPFKREGLAITEWDGSA